MKGFMNESQVQDVQPEPVTPPVPPVTPPVQKPKFVLEVHEPYATFVNNEPQAISYIIEGLIPQGTYSHLGAKPKHGKSCISRSESVCIAKGTPFLGRKVEQGEVLLCSLEDPRQHIDNCLQVLGYDKEKDARIHIVEKLPRNITETIDLLGEFLTQHPDIRFVVFDTLAKVVRAKDSTNYDEMLILCEKLSHMAREFKHLHIQGLGHCKKVKQEDPFDAFLGSVEIRGETDSNIVIYDTHGHRVIQSETRIGTPWEATILNADLIQKNDTQYVKEFSLGGSLDSEVAMTKATHDAQKRVSYENRLITFLKEQNGKAAWTDYWEKVPGSSDGKQAAVENLAKKEVIRRSGVAKSKTNPQYLQLLKPDYIPSGFPSGFAGLTSHKYCADPNHCVNLAAEGSEYCEKHICDACGGFSHDRENDGKCHRCRTNEMIQAHHAQAQQAQKGELCTN